MRAMFNVIFVVFLLAGIPGMARDEQAAGDGLHMKPVVWQAEAQPSVGIVTNGPDWRTVPDDTAAAGGWILCYTQKEGDFLELTLPHVLPGRYRVSLRYKAHAQRPTCRVSLGAADGSDQEQVGTPFAMHDGEGWREKDVGIVSVPRPDFRTLRITVAEESGEAAKLSLDQVAFTPVGDNLPGKPAGLRASSVQPNHLVLQWNPLDAKPKGYLIDRKGGKTKEWQLTGFVPGAETSFTAPGLCDGTEYVFRVTAYTEDGRGPASAPLSVQTPAAEHSRKGEVLAASPGRIGGATMMLRKDGSILLYAHYQNRLADQGRFEIHRMVSRDHGKTWSELEPFMAADDKSFMMPALLRLRNGDALFCYTERNVGLTWGKRWCRRSQDGGMTWSEPVLATDDLPLEGHGMTFRVPTGPHDRLVQTESGRVLFPIHFPWFPKEGGGAHTQVRQIASAVYYSDDRGASWKRACGPMMIRGMTPAQAGQRDLEGLWEPSIVELKPGHLLMYLRSNTGWYYESRSSDNGATWSPPRQSTVRAPLCPAKLVKLDNGMIGIVFNGIIDPSHQNLSRRWDLATMVSGDGGETWTNCRTLEFADPYAKPKHHLLYCYPSVLFDGDRLHMTYYGPVKGQQFNMLHRILPADWFTASGAKK